MPPILLLALAWLCGLALGRLVDPRVALLWLAGAGLLALINYGRLAGRQTLALAALLTAALGLWRGLPAEALVAPPPAGATAVRGVLEASPRPSERRASATLAASAARVGAAWQPYDGRLSLSLPLYPALAAGDVVEIDGRPEETATIDDPRTAAWLRREGLAGELWAREARLLERAPEAGSAGWRDRVARAGTGLLDRYLPAPAAALAAGVLIGERGALPPELRAAFRDTGTIHMLVVSGWNMTLVAGAVGWVVARLGGRLRLAGLALTLALLAGYAALAGGDAAVLRAALMAGLAAVGLALGRRSDPIVALTLAAAVMAGANPATLADLGFQLSFLATLGLLLAMPALSPWLATLPRPARWVAEPLAATLAAQAAVEPLLAHATGQVSPIAPLVNLVAAPLVPAIMLGGLAVVGGGLAGLPLLPDLAALATTAAGAALIWVVEQGARLPLAGLRVPPPSLWMTAAIYAGLALLAAPLLTPDPVATGRRLLGGLRAHAPALGMAALGLGAAVVWLVLLTS